MNDQIAEHARINFDTGWRTALQQEDHILAPCYTTRSSNDAKESRYDFTGSLNTGVPPVTARQRTGRLGRTLPTVVPTFQRSAFVKPWEITTIWDRYDKNILGELGDIQSPVVQAHAAGMNRLLDQLAINALLGTAYMGENGTTAVILPTSQTVAVNYVKTGSPANSGLTLDKIIKANYILNKSYVPRRDRFFLFTADQEKDLIENVDAVGNSRYTDIQAIKDGQIDGKTLLGFTFKMVELLPIDSSSIRSNVAFHKSMLGRVLGMEKESRIDQLPTEGYNWQVNTALVTAFTRLQEAGVVKVLCDESV